MSFVVSDDKESSCNAGNLGSVPGLGRSPGEGNSYPLLYSCLENSMTEEPGGLHGPWGRRVGPSQATFTLGLAELSSPIAHSRSSRSRPACGNHLVWSLLLQPSTRVRKTSATLKLSAPTWVQISTGARVSKATAETASCACQWTPASSTSETARQSPRCADTMGLDR